MTERESKPNYVVIDGLNVMGRAQNHWAMDPWFGLTQVLMILKSVSKRVFGGLEVITVLREHGAFEKEYVSERWESVSRLSRLVLLSARSGREDDDYLVMSLSKLHDGLFMSHDLSIQDHIGEDKEWSERRRIFIQMDPVTRGIRLEIPPSKVRDGYDKLTSSEHLPPLLDGERTRSPVNDDVTHELVEDSCGSEGSHGSDFGRANCTYCGIEITSVDRAVEHARNTGHNHYRGWSLPSGGMHLEGSIMIPTLLA